MLLQNIVQSLFKLFFGHMLSKLGEVTIAETSLEMQLGFESASFIPKRMHEPILLADCEPSLV